MIKFSLATLLLVVLLAAVGCAALVNANDLWRQAMVTAAVAALLIATLAAVIDRSRAFTVGFAIAGWIYLILVFVPAVSLRDDLLTDKAVQELFSILHDDEAPQPQYLRTIIGFSADGKTSLVGAADPNSRALNAITRRLPGARPPRDYENFADVGHSLWVIIVGFLGGASASFLGSKRNKSDSAQVCSSRKKHRRLLISIIG